VWAHGSPIRGHTSAVARHGLPCVGCLKQVPKPICQLFDGLPRGAELPDRSAWTCRDERDSHGPWRRVWAWCRTPDAGTSPGGPIRHADGPRGVRCTQETHV